MSSEHGERWYNWLAAWLYGVVAEPLMDLAIPAWTAEAEADAREAEEQEIARQCQLDADFVLAFRSLIARFPVSEQPSEEIGAWYNEAWNLMDRTAGPVGEQPEAQPEREPAPQWFVDEVRQSVGTILNAPDAETEAKREVAEADHLWAAALRAPLGEPVAYLAEHPETGERLLRFWHDLPSGPWILSSLYRTPQERSNGSVPTEKEKP